MIRRRGLLPAAAALAAPATAAPPREILVGPDQAFRRLGAAIGAAREGDTLLVAAGAYPDDIAEIRKRLHIRAVGGLARILATAPPPNGKAILVVAADARLEGLDLAGATSPDRNGAGIRYEGGHLALHRCRLRGNEMNLLAAGDRAGRIVITRCEFGPTRPTAGLSHGLYVNDVGELLLEDSLFHGAASGHQVKSRALRTTIRGCRIHDADGGGAYLVDLPNGGAALLEDNVLAQGPFSAHPAMVHYGGEAPPWPDSALVIRRNTVVNRYPGGQALLLRNQTPLRAAILGNRVFGLVESQLATGPAVAAGTTWLDVPPAPDPTPPWL